MRFQKTLYAAIAAAVLLSEAPVASAAAPEACADVDNDIARLQCYDGIYPPRRSGHGGTSALPAQAAPPVAAAPPPPAVKPEEAFGLSEGLVRKKKNTEVAEAPPLEALSAKVTSTTEQANGNTVVHLDNGQAWVQTERRLGFTLTPGETVTITRGVLSSFWLKDDSNLSVRVRRLR